MTTKEIAVRYHEMAVESRFAEMRSALYSPDAVSVEPENNSGLPHIVQGMKAFEEKEKLFYNQFEKLYSGYCNEPIVAGNFFSCAMGLDVTIKGKGRMQKDQLAIFEVKDGKIIREQFFYHE